MNKYLQFFLMLLLVAGSAAAYEYRMPVNVQCTSNPAVLMPGDEALLAVEMQSGSASYGVGKDAGSGSTAQSALLSTPINKTVLKGTHNLKVLTADYTNLGMIGPDDKITAYYKIKASDNITSGTYMLSFLVQGGYDMITINRVIPIKVDSATVDMARAEASSTKQSFNLNVANPRENTLNAVTIVPSATEIKFSPDEYYIGTMDPDEVFTISFSLESPDPSKQIKGATNVSFVAKFKNGDTWHQSLPYVSSYTPPVDNTNQNSYLVPAGIVVVILFAAGVYLYRKNKLPIKPKNGSRQT